MCQPSAFYVRSTPTDKANEGLHWTKIWTHEIYPFFQVLTDLHAFCVQRLELSSVWALLAAFEDPLPIAQNNSYGAFEGAFVRDVDSLSWMANNTQKLFPLETDRPECWTFFSTASYGRKNKVPQVAFWWSCSILFGYIIWLHHSLQWLIERPYVKGESPSFSSL